MFTDIHDELRGPTKEGLLQQLDIIRLQITQGQQAILASRNQELVKRLYFVLKMAADNVKKVATTFGIDVDE